MAATVLEKTKTKTIKKTAKVKLKPEKKFAPKKVIKTAEPISTGYAELDRELAFLSGKQIAKLTDYARYLNWSAIIDKDDAEYDEDDDPGRWADLPLTRDEEEAMGKGREDVRNGKMLSLEEFLEGL